MKSQKVIVFPCYIAQLGGASSVRIVGKIANVEVGGRVIPVALSKIADVLDCGFKVANVALLSWV